MKKIMKKLNIFLYNTIYIMIFHLPVFCYIVLYKIIQPELIGEVLLLIIVLPPTFILAIKLLRKLGETYKED